MNPNKPLFDGILLPSDHTRASLSPFYHGLCLAMMSRSHLRLVRVDPPKHTEVFDAFPRVRETLSRWQGSSSQISDDELQALGVGVRKVQARHEDPFAAVHRLLQKHQRDFLVMASHRSKTRALQKPLSLQLIDQVQGLSLIIPEGVRGFIDANGKINLKSVLVALFEVRQMPLLLDALRRLALILGIEQLEGNLLWLGAGPWPPTEMPAEDGFWRWQTSAPQGDRACAIAEAASVCEARLIAWMPPRPNGLKALLGKDLRQQVLDRVACPLLVTPPITE